VVSASQMDLDGSSDDLMALESLVQREDDEDNLRDICVDLLDATNESDLENVKE